MSHTDEVIIRDDRQIPAYWISRDDLLHPGEKPLIVQPTLIRRLGLLEALIVQHVYEHASHTYDGHAWASRTYRDLSAVIGVSPKACRGACDRLRAAGVVAAIPNPRNPLDQTRWWRVVHERVQAIVAEART